MKTRATTTRNKEEKTYSHKERGQMLAAAKFSPSFDLSKILLSDGTLYHQIDSKYKYFNYNESVTKNIVDFENDVEIINFSVIKNSPLDDSSKSDDTSFPHNTTTTTKLLPEFPCLLKLKTGRVAVFIPYSELIFLS